MTAPEPPITVKLREWNAQLRDALGDMIHEFGAGAGWRTEKQEAALAKALQVFLGRPVVERDGTAYWRLSAHVENALAPVLGYEYDEAVGWNVGEHTAESLVMAAANRITELAEALDAVLDLDWQYYFIIDTVEKRRDKAIQVVTAAVDALARVRSES